MKKVLINYNAKDNFGDDLFVRIICGYFPKARFKVLVPKGSGKGIESVPNLKITAITPKNAEKTYLKTVAKADICLYTGGPAFVEDSYDMREFWDFRGLLQSKPLYYINSDFGPYRTEAFLDDAREHLDQCAGVWFRDKYSCGFFDGDNIHYMPPISFLADFPEPFELGKPYAVLSVVDLSGRQDLSMLCDKYIETMKHIARRLKERGLEVVILPLCDYEWDGRTASELEGYGTVMPYNGNTSAVLSLIRGAQCVIGSRFQAIICALAAEVPAVPICYGDNLPHALSDIDSGIRCFDVRHLDELTDSELDAAINYRTKIDVEVIKMLIRVQLDKLSDAIYKK